MKRLTLIALPYSRLSLLGWGWLLKFLGVMAENGWDGAPTRTLRCKDSGYLITLDLAKWSDRLSFFLGRYHDLALGLFLKAVLRSGETFIDVGGNIGLVTLHGAALVGPSGRVHAFEPNPTMLERLKQHIEANSINHVRVHHAGLSDMHGELTLRVLLDEPGQGTFCEVYTDDSPLVTQHYRARVCIGDDVLEPDLPGPATIKIDVEGYELHVLRGLSGTMERLRPVVYTEISGDYLCRAGTSPEELFDHMHSFGYVAHAVGTVRHRLSHRLRLSPAPAPRHLNTENAVWLHPDSPVSERLREFIIA